MKIALGMDHNGSEVKSHIINYLYGKNIEIIDQCKKNNELDDYPDFAFKVGESVASKEADLGILICGTGIGMSIAANKVKGIRCAHVSNEVEAALTREHNNANVLALSAKNTPENIMRIIEVFINTNFSNEERHIRRIEKISKYEVSEYNV